MKPPVPTPLQTLNDSWIQWWRRLGPSRQDRFAFLAPLMAVVLFMAAILAAFWYLKYEELNREQELVQRDVEYAQQRLRLRLMERQETLLRVAREIQPNVSRLGAFLDEAETLLEQSPEISALVLLDPQRRVRAMRVNPTSPNLIAYRPGQTLTQGDEVNSFDLARDLAQPVYSQPFGFPLIDGSRLSVLQLHVPLFDHGRFVGAVVAQYSIDGILRHAVPQEVVDKYAVSLRDVNNNVLAGQATKRRPRVTEVLPMLAQTSEYEVPITPVGYALTLHAQPYRTSQSLTADGLFWLVSALSAITAWLLVASWRHTRRRIQAQKALLAETNFRRAMENSILTGMRAMDMQGRITYVNAAFCQMTGWSERELVGQAPPFPYWPDDEKEQLTQTFLEELNGRTPQSGFQVRVKRKNGTLFDARLYVSPLVDAKGMQTGWMTSMTDITEPNRIRDQLAAAHDRFTTVLEGLDAAVSVAPLGSQELLFANRLYRQWFGTSTLGHLQLVAQAGMPAQTEATLEDADDPLAGLPTDSLTEVQSEHAEIHVIELDKWLEVRSRYLNWVDGRLAQMVIATDITSRRQAEELAEQQAERAQTASRLITMGEMASSVAHELNQPLTAINNYCNGMVSRIRANNLKPDELLSALEKTAHQAQRAGQIIQRIRSFVKRSEPNRSHADVGTIVSEAVELAGIELRRRQVKLVLSVAEHLPALHADPILLEQVLINLLKNAAESIDTAKRPPGRRQVELAVARREEEGQPVIEFAVTDTGQGLPPEVMQHLFEAFYSTKAEGMGIGLNLCRSIVESHQGRMRAENLYNGSQITGCRFSFWIPLHDLSNPHRVNTAKGGAGVSV